MDKKIFSTRMKDNLPKKMTDFKSVYFGNGRFFVKKDCERGNKGCPKTNLEQPFSSLEIHHDFWNKNEHS